MVFTNIIYTYMLTQLLQKLRAASDYLPTIRKY